MEISISELAEYAEHVRRTEQNGKVTVTNNYNEERIAELEAELATYHGPDAWDDLWAKWRAAQGEAATKAARVEELSRELEQARDFNTQCSPGNRHRVEAEISERLLMAGASGSIVTGKTSLDAALMIHGPLADVVALISDELVRQGLVK